MRHKLIITIAILVLQTGLKAQSLSLDSCKVYALENNKSLKESRLHLQASEQVKKNAFTNYFPHVEAGAIAMQAQKGLLELETPDMNLPVYNGNPANLATAAQFAYVPGMNLELIDYANIGFVMAVQPIYTGGRIINGNKLAELGIDVSELMVEMTTDEVIQNTENYYWTIVALQEKMKTLMSYKKLVQNLESDITVAYNAGLVQKSDLLKIKMELNTIEANKLKLENGIDLVKLTLAQHMGVNYGNSFSITDTLVEIIEPSKLYTNPDDAIAYRTEYKLLNKSVEAEELQKKMARGEYLPQVSVGAQAFYLDIMEKGSSNGLGFAMVSIPISDWWGGSHKLKEHTIKIKIAQNNLDEKSELLKLQMNKTYNDLNESFMQIVVAESTVEQATEYYTVMRNNFEAGMVGTSDILESQATLQQATNGLVEAKTAYKIKQAIYLQAISQLK